MYGSQRTQEPAIEFNVQHPSSRVSQAFVREVHPALAHTSLAFPSTSPVTSSILGWHGFCFSPKIGTHLPLIILDCAYELHRPFPGSVIII